MTAVHLLGPTQVINEPPRPFALTLFVILVEIVNFAQACKESAWQRLYAPDCFQQSLMPLIDSVEIFPSHRFLQEAKRVLLCSQPFRTIIKRVAGILCQLIERILFYARLQCLLKA